MADEPEKTPVKNKYAQLYADDLEANRKEQADVTEQITGLQMRLEQLRVDEAWLSKAQGSLPSVVPPSGREAGPTAEAAETEFPAPAPAVADALQTVPPPRQDKPVKAAQTKQPAKKAAAKKTTARKTTAKKTTAKKAAAKKSTAKMETAEVAPAQTPTVEVSADKPAPKKKTGPPLHELILAILLKTPGEPRMAREVTDLLAQDHPDRATSVQAVRNNLETLAKKNAAVEKSKRQGSVMYTAFAAADAASAADDAAGGAAEEAPETAAEKVPAKI